MARGWDSKAVEDQIASLEQRRTEPGAPTPTEAERERVTKYQTLLLTRVKIARDFENARNERHRDALDQALRTLDAEIKRLGPP